MKPSKLTKSQVKTLGILQSIGGWVNSWQIQKDGGSCASLPRLIELEMVAKTEIMYKTFWRSITDADLSIAFDYAKINPFHAHLESLNPPSCRYVTGAQVLVSQATTMGEVNGHTAIDILMEAINYIIKQETCGQPLDEAAANSKVEPLVGLLREGIFQAVTH